MSQSDDAKGAEPSALPATDISEFLPEQLNFHQRRARPVLGGSLWIFGALLWTYLVMGELVVNLKVNELLAMLIVAGAVGVAWYGAVRQAPPGRLLPKIAPGIAGILLFCVILFLAASVFGTTRRSAIEAFTVAFWFPAVLAYVMGRRLTANPKLELSRRRRAAGIAMWVASSLGTALALLSAISQL